MIGDLGRQLPSSRSLEKIEIRNCREVIYPGLS